MPRKSQTVRVGRRKIELSNLEKVLYPDDHILKAELIEYYLKIGPTILAHLKGRPLSLVRCPDGIGGERFFQKNRPEWAPEWIEHVVLGSGKEEDVDYMIATEEASLVWLANLASIELHQMHCRSPHFERPDYFVFDLDPPENFSFDVLTGIALEMKEHIEDFGYHPFVKTTGSKGLHILVPIEPRWTFDKVFEAAKEVAGLFVHSHGSSTTLQVRKEARKGRALVDIYRNRTFQSIVAAYSLRGLPGAPVSMPLRWEELAGLASSADFTIRTVPGHVLRHGDAWEGSAAYAAALHTARKSTFARKRRAGSPGHEAPAIFREYAGKRRFGKTPEPPPTVDVGEGDGFVLHRHHATRLHYDLRIEREGALKSWAMPKGLPPRPGIMRLAVPTEDHPLEYMNFEGTIPKGQYGGGEIWIFARGRCKITKEKKGSFHFRLESREVSGEYRMHRTRDETWLLEREDRPQVDWLRDPVEPMLAQSADRPPGSGDYVYEVKWDGIRAMIALDEGELRIRSRSQHDVTGRFPELLIPEQAFRATSALFDAEIVCLDDEGRPVFQEVIHRLQQTGKGAIERTASRHPAVCYIFDCLYLDGRPIVKEPLLRRRVWMEDAVRSGTTYRVSETVSDGAELFRAAAGMELEGIMAKEMSSIYQPGMRSPQWLKIKRRRTTECVIIGYTRGKGGRRASFGALHLAFRDGEGLRYAGKVGTGFDERMSKEVLVRLKKIRPVARPVERRPADDGETVWLEPSVICEVQYASLTKDGILREPVFLRLRPDLNL